jgi:polar amino acid transport system substrate-binding protein
MNASKAATGSFEEIKKRGYLLYGFNGERPYNYTDADGNLIGSEIEIARAVAKAIGIEDVQGVAMNFDSFIPAILAGRIDTCLPIFVKPARCEKIAFARPHLIEGQSAIVTAGNPKGINGWDDLVAKDVKVGLITGTTPNEIAQSAGVDDSKITRFPDTTTLAAGLTSNRVDIVVEASSTIRLILEGLDKSKFERVASWSKPTNYTGKIEFFAAYPFSLDATELRNAFDEQLDKILESGELDKIAGKYGFSSADRPGKDAPTLEQICAG